MLCNREDLDRIAVSLDCRACPLALKVRRKKRLATCRSPFVDIEGVSECKRRCSLLHSPFLLKSIPQDGSRTHPSCTCNRTRMDQHHSTMFYDPKRVLTKDRDFDTMFSVSCHRFRKS